MESENLNLDTMAAAEIFCINNVECKSQEETNCKRQNNVFHELSKVYAQILVIITVMAVFIEVLHGPIPLFYIHAYFYFYLLGVSILIFVSSFISRFIHKLNGGNLDLEIWEKNNNHLNITRYFIFGLVVCGAAAFASTFLGSISAFISRVCASSTIIVFHVLHSTFLTLQLPFLFYVCFLCVRFNFAFGCFHKIGIMHLVATNVALWLYTLLWESSKDWQEVLHVKHNSTLSWGQQDINITMHSLESNIKSFNQTDHFPKHVVHFTSNCWWRVVPENEFSEDILSVQLCLQNSSVGIMWKKTFKCLYAFNVQYYLIVLFLLYIIWENSTLRCKNQCSSMSMNAHKAGCCFFLSKGFYLGCLYFAASIVIVILYFVLRIPNFNVVITSMLCIIFASAIFAVLVGFCPMKSSMTNFKSPNQSAINCYQGIGIYFVYVYGAINLFLGCLSEEKYNVLLIVEALLMIFHAVSQYIFIKSTSKSRQAVNFLILCNASLWILESSVFCYNTSAHVQIKLYGIAWPIMNRIIVPCLAFYRLHSAVVFFNMSKFLSVEYR